MYGSLLGALFRSLTYVGSGAAEWLCHRKSQAWRAAEDHDVGREAFLSKLQKNRCYTTRLKGSWV